MRLDYSKFNSYIYSFQDIDETEIEKAQYVKDEIAKRLEKIALKQREIDNLIYEKNLIVEDCVECISDDLNLSYYNLFRYFNSNLLYKAWRYFNNEDNEEYKDDETSCTFALEKIKSTLIPEKYANCLELTHIYDFNYATSYEFYFKVIGTSIEFKISIPVFSNANSENYKVMLHGYTLSYIDDSVHRLIYASLEFEEFKTTLCEWLDDILHEKREVEE